MRKSDSPGHFIKETTQIFLYLSLQPKAGFTVLHQKSSVPGWVQISSVDPKEHFSKISQVRLQIKTPGAVRKAVIIIDCLLREGQLRQISISICA